MAGLGDCAPRPVVRDHPTAQGMPSSGESQAKAAIDCLALGHELRAIPGQTVLARRRRASCAADQAHSVTKRHSWLGKALCRCLLECAALVNERIEFVPFQKRACDR